MAIPVWRGVETDSEMAGTEEHEDKQVCGFEQTNINFSVLYLKKKSINVIGESKIVDDCAAYFSG